MTDYVRVFTDTGFGGQFADVAPGEYKADNGTHPIPNDTLSSLQVPFGLCVDLWEHETGGIKRNYQSGDHHYVGDDFNDRCSYIQVFPWTDIYLSTDDPSVPAWISSETITSHNKGAGDSYVISATINNGWYSKTTTYNVPAGRSINVWEATRSGDANWSHTFDGSVLTVTVSVHVRGAFAARNWIGVRVQVL